MAFFLCSIYILIISDSKNTFFVDVSYGCWPYRDLHHTTGFYLNRKIWNSRHSYFLSFQPLIICGPRATVWYFLVLCGCLLHSFDQRLFKCACLLPSGGKEIHSVWHGKVFPSVSSETCLGYFSLLSCIARGWDQSFPHVLHTIVISYMSSEITAGLELLVWLLLNLPHFQKFAKDLFCNFCNMWDLSIVYASKKSNCGSQRRKQGPVLSSFRNQHFVRFWKKT